MITKLTKTRTEQLIKW